VIGESLTLHEDRQHRPGAVVDEGALCSQPPVNMVEVQRGPGRQVHQLSALRGQVASEGRDEVIPEGDHLASRHRPHVDSGKPAELYLGLDGVQAMPGARSRRGHARARLPAQITHTKQNLPSERRVTAERWILHRPVQPDSPFHNLGGTDA
jgi:hypothetical protein